MSPEDVPPAYVLPPSYGTNLAPGEPASLRPQASASNSLHGMTTRLAVGTRQRGRPLDPTFGVPRRYLIR